MATELKLMHSTTELSLKQATDSGWRHITWIPAMATPIHGSDPPLAVEKMVLQVAAASHDALATDLQEMTDMQRWAAEYRADRTHEHPVWLHAKMTNETGERRAWVHTIKTEPITDELSATGFPADNKMKFNVEITRGPWERTTARSMPAARPGALDFDAGDSEPTVGETVTGDASGHTGTLAWYVVTSGTWAGSNAAGVLYFSHTTGAFQDNEALNGSTTGDGFADADGTRKGGAVLIYDHTATADVVGDLPARIRYFQIEPDAGDSLGRVWAGFRSAEKHGATGLTKFWAVWECESGSNYTDVSDTADSTASDDTRITVSESAVDWDDGDFHSIFYLNLANLGASGLASGDEDDQFGRFKWLMRGMLSGSGSWEIRMRWWHLGTTYIEGPVTEITSTSWDYFDCGNQTFPLRDLQTILQDDRAASTERRFGVLVMGRRTSGGSEDLYLDCMIPLPIDEGFLYAEFGDCGGNSDDVVCIGESPHGKVQALTYTGATPGIDELVEVAPENFRLPPGDGRMYLVTARNASSDITDINLINYDNSGKYYERWGILRGGE